MASNLNLNGLKFEPEWLQIWTWMAWCLNLNGLKFELGWLKFEPDLNGIEFEPEWPNLNLGPLGLQIIFFPLVKSPSLQGLLRLQIIFSLWSVKEGALDYKGLRDCKSYFSLWSFEIANHIFPFDTWRMEPFITRAFGIVNHIFPFGEEPLITRAFERANPTLMFHHDLNSIVNPTNKLCDKVLLHMTGNLKGFEERFHTASYIHNIHLILA